MVHPVILPHHQLQESILVIECGFAVIHCHVVGQLVPHYPLVLDSPFFLVRLPESLMETDHTVIICRLQTIDHLAFVCVYWGCGVEPVHL